MCFSPHLVRGSLIVQQDFLFYKNPWLYPTMHKLSDSVELLSHTEDYSVIFGVHSNISKEGLKSILSENTSYQETIESINYFRSKFSNLRQIEMIDALLASFKSAPKESMAWKIPNTNGIKISFEE